MIDKEYVKNNISNIEGLKNTTILKALMEFKEQLETSGAYHSISIGEVKTLEWEENAYVVNVGTTTDLVLNFGIPKGVGFNYVGEWVSTNNEYHPYDVVVYEYTAYVCVNSVENSDTPPNLDVNNWSLFVGYGSDVGNFILNEYETSINDPITHNSKMVEAINNAKLSIYNNLKGTKLWSNENTSFYGEANLSDSIENYDLFAVKYYYWSSASNALEIKFFELKQSGSRYYRLEGTDVDEIGGFYSLYCREFIVDTNTKITFKEGYYIDTNDINTLETDNRSCVPYEIRGYKVGENNG